MPIDHHERTILNRGTHRPTTTIEFARRWDVGVLPPEPRQGVNVDHACRPCVGAFSVNNLCRLARDHHVIAPKEFHGFDDFRGLQRLRCMCAGVSQYGNFGG